MRAAGSRVPQMQWGGGSQTESPRLLAPHSGGFYAALVFLPSLSTAQRWHESCLYILTLNVNS